MSGKESLFKGNVSSLYLDFVRLNTLLEGYATMVPQMQTMQTVLSLFADMQAWGTKDRGEMVVHMQDKERNALETICTTVNAMVEAELSAADNE